jgi:hypothetical protein
MSTKITAAKVIAAAQRSSAQAAAAAPLISDVLACERAGVRSHMTPAEQDALAQALSGFARRKAMADEAARLDSAHTRLCDALDAAHAAFGVADGMGYTSPTPSDVTRRDDVRRAERALLALAGAAALIWWPQ